MVGSRFRAPATGGRAALGAMLIGVPRESTPAGERPELHRAQRFAECSAPGHARGTGMRRFTAAEPCQTHRIESSKAYPRKREEPINIPIMNSFR